MQLLPLIHRGMEWIVGSSWLKKISQPLLFLIIFLSSSQLGLHFWPSSAFVYGIRIDYLSPTIYFVDCLIILYLIVNFNQFRTLRSKLLGTFFSILLVNLIFSQNPWASLNWSAHFMLYLIFILSFPSKLVKLIPSALLSSLLLQLLLAGSQVMLGHSIQGVFYYLGERILSVGLPNVAVGSFMDNFVLRAYGTFSHPNVLAGYAVITLLTITQLIKQRAVRRSDLVGNPTRSDLKGSVVTKVTTFIVIFIVLLTQSRAAALALFGIVIPLYYFISLRSRLIYFILSLASLSYILSSGILSRPLDLSVGQRFSLQQVSVHVISAYPIFGVGASAAITRYPDLVPNFRLLQPDHNSLTLFLSWFGLFGVLSLACYLFKFENLRIYDLRLLHPLLPLLLFDHYLLTSMQGLFILLLFLRVNCLYDFRSQTSRK